MPRYSSPIVGMWHHPPANGILRVAPHNARLILRPEPQNPYDPNAIMVWIRTESFNQSAQQLAMDHLTAELQGFGITLDDFFAQPEWMLGYIPRGAAALITLPSDTEGTLSFDATGGKPLAVFTYEGNLNE